MKIASIIVDNIVYMYLIFFKQRSWEALKRLQDFKKLCFASILFQHCIISPEIWRDDYDDVCKYIYKMAHNILNKNHKKDNITTPY